MKSAIAILATLVTLAAAAPVWGQDWVMDWTSTGNFQFGSWNISGQDPHASLIPVSTPPSLPPTFTGQPYALGFTWSVSGQSYGGLVAQQSPNFQTSDWTVPAPCNSALGCRFNNDFASGQFALTDANHFTLSVDLGAGHNNAHLVAVGSRAGTTASALEPATIGLGAIGLFGAVLLRRRRQA